MYYFVLEHGLDAVLRDDDRDHVIMCYFMLEHDLLTRNLMLEHGVLLTW